MALKRRALRLSDQLRVKVERMVVGRLSRMGLLSTLKRNWLEYLYLLVLFILTGGFVNSILEGSRFGGAPILLTRSAQTFSETLINTFTILLGTAGLYLMYLSGRRMVRQRVTNMYLILGLVTILMALFIGMFLMSVKRL